jgi:hypothetical protein
VARPYIIRAYGEHGCKTTNYTLLANFCGNCTAEEISKLVRQGTEWLCSCCRRSRGEKLPVPGIESHLLACQLPTEMVYGDFRCESNGSCTCLDLHLTE